MYNNALSPEILTTITTADRDTLKAVTESRKGFCDVLKFKGPLRDAMGLCFISSVCLGVIVPMYREFNMATNPMKQCIESLSDVSTLSSSLPEDVPAYKYQSGVPMNLSTYMPDPIKVDVEMFFTSQNINDSDNISELVESLIEKIYVGGCTGFVINPSAFMSDNKEYCQSAVTSAVYKWKDLFDCIVIVEEE